MSINKKYFKYFIGVTVAVGSVISCGKDLNKKDPNVEDVNGYFTTSAELLNATNSIYSALHSQPLVAREWFFVHDLRADEVTSGGGQLEAPRAQM